MNLLKFFKIVKSSGLNINELKAMSALRSGELRMFEIRDTATISRTHIYRVMKDIEKLNLVSVNHRKIENPEHSWDKRKSFPFYSLTSEGEAVLRGLERSLDA